MAAAALELGDVQGLIARGYSTLNAARFLLLGLDDAEAAQRWLASIVDAVTVGDERPEGRAVNVAFTGSGTAWCVGANAATPPSGGNEAGTAGACDCTVTTQCLVSGARSAINVSAYPGVSIGTLPAALIFDSKLGAITPLGVRSVTLTSPRGKYDLRVEINALGQARLCVPATKPVIAGVSGC